MTNEEIHEKIKKIEADLVEQEHRPIKVISNFLFRKKLWPKNDIRRVSSTKSLIWKLFFSPGMIAASGGIIAILTLFVFFQQNRIILDQNSLISQQNKSLINQLQLETRFELERNLYNEEYNSSKRRLDLLSYTKLLKNLGEKPIIEGVEISSGKYDSIQLLNCIFLPKRYYSFRNSYIENPRFESYLFSIEEVMMITETLQFSSIRNSKVRNLYRGRFMKSDSLYGISTLFDVSQNELIYDKRPEEIISEATNKMAMKGKSLFSSNYMFYLPKIDSSIVKVEPNIGYIYHSEIENSKIHFKSSSFFGHKKNNCSNCKLENNTIYVTNKESDFLIGSSIYKNNIFILNNIRTLGMSNFRGTSKNEFQFQGKKYDSVRIEIRESKDNLYSFDTIWLKSNKSIKVSFSINHILKKLVDSISNTQINIGNRKYIGMEGITINKIDFY